jgi:hypothetical protein
MPRGYSIEAHPIRCPTQDDRQVAPIGLNTTDSFLFSALPWGRSPERPGKSIVEPTPHLRQSDLAMGTFHPLVRGTARLCATLRAVFDLWHACVGVAVQGMQDARRHGQMEGIHMAHSAMRRSGGLTCVNGYFCSRDSVRTLTMGVLCDQTTANQPALDNQP